jgi:hypothetical protein
MLLSHILVLVLLILKLSRVDSILKCVTSVLISEGLLWSIENVDLLLILNNDVVHWKSLWMFKSCLFLDLTVYINFGVILFKLIKLKRL